MCMFYKYFDCICINIVILLKIKFQRNVFFVEFINIFFKCYILLQIIEVYSVKVDVCL